MTYIKPYHKFRDQPPELIEELLSNYLINSWSYSGAAEFARHEKAFEMHYIYRMDSKKSSVNISGSAYHAALEFFFNGLKSGVFQDIATLQSVAFEFIDNVPANAWKLQKTSPTVEESKSKAYKTASVLLTNFFGELSTYTDEIEEVVEVELYLDEWLHLNGVDIPLPCHMRIDLVVKTKSGKRVIIDHKSKTTFSDEKDIAFNNGKQAITYVLGYEMATGEKIDEVWFIENKASQNKDKTAQLILFPVVIDDNSRKLYELMLYEPLKRMIEAVNNPDYVYLINESDNFTDTAEINEFWAQTLIAEVEDFNIPDDKKEMIRNRQRKIRDASIFSISPSVIKKFRAEAASFIQYDLSGKNMTNGEKIEHILKTFGIDVRVKHVFNGYSSATFLLEVAAGIPISRVQQRSLDVANALDVANVRMMKELYMHEGKSYLAVESAKKREENLIFHPDYLKSGNKIPLGIDNFGKVIYWDLDNPSTPHMLVCGGTGSGKSVFIRSCIEYCRLAGIEKIVILDPKFEFIREYANTVGVSVISDIENIELEMAVLVDEMNGLVKSGRVQKTLVIFDEFADAEANSRSGNALKNYSNVCVGLSAKGIPKMKRECTSVDKSLEENLRILLQKGRSCGFRIAALTQRASVKVITGDAKVNFPIRVCFRVNSEVDSKVVIDEPGAEALQGNGDGLIKSPEYLDTIRFQAFYKE
ncbi:MAG: PD-(D/E)XK nuclease family protein [Bacteroidales bacterium]|nr:PD-(D/E)XK nuclease family protein [Bacteroidales bacterium]